MAFFGAPVASRTTQARRGDARRDAGQFAKAAPPFGPGPGELSLGVGLHTGEAIVGTIGSDEVMDYTVVGDAVNIAQRLQGSRGRPGPAQPGHL